MTRVRITPAATGCRLAAWLLDAALTACLMLMVIYRYSGGFDLVTFVLQTNYTQLGVLVGLPFLAQLVFMSAYRASPGMFAMDLEMIKDEGDPVEFSNLVRRPLGLAAFLLTAGLAAALPYMNDRRRTIGDILSGTRVIEAPCPGRRVAYDTWRLFKASLRSLLPVSVAAAIALLLLSRDDGPNKTIVLDALLLASTIALLLSSLGAALRSKLTRVRLTERGIQRSGWLGWKKGVIDWADIDFARYRPARLCPYFEVHRHNRRRFRVPIEHDTAQLTAGTFANFGVRIEQ
jgi:uncharacterized RDD family membrane protein YckC